jgi:microcystin-dependent protein
MEVFIGTILPFGFNYAPTGWQMCNGQLLPISQYQAVFALIGTYYGGNGTSNFALPNLQGRLPMHMGNGLGLSSRTLGEMAGTETATLLTSNLPQHNHALNATTAAAASAAPSTPNNVLAAANGADNQGNPVTVQIYGPAPVNAVLNPTSIGMTGGSQPFEIMPPFLVLNFCFAMTGIYPARN